MLYSSEANNKLQAVLRGVSVGASAGFRAAPQIVSHISFAGAQGALAERVATAVARGVSFITFGIPNAFKRVGAGIYKFGQFIVKIVKKVIQGAKTVITWKGFKTIGNAVKAYGKYAKSNVKASKQFAKDAVPKSFGKKHPKAAKVVEYGLSVAVRNVGPLLAYGIVDAVSE